MSTPGTVLPIGLEVADQLPGVSETDTHSNPGTQSSYGNDDHVSEPGEYATPRRSSRQRHRSKWLQDEEWPDDFSDESS